MSERPAASYGFPILVVCGIVTTAVLALLVGRVGGADPAPAAPARAAEAPASSASAADAATDAAAPSAEPLRLPFGPDAASRIPAPSPPAHLTGGANAAAVLALPGGSPATAALHWLDGGGVPTTVAETLDEALEHAVVVVLGGLPDTDVPRLEAYARAGGIVVLEQPASALLATLAGVGDPTSEVRDSFVVLPGGGIDAATVRFPATDATGWGLDTGALARYPDGEAAIAARQLDAGVVIALGVSLRGSVLASEASVVAPSVPASDEPSVGAALGRDVMAHLGRTIYSLAAPGITLGGAPDGRAAALVLTHDVDTADALARAAELAAIERDRDVSATYFVTAQATAGPGAPAVLDTASADRLQELESLGADLQSGGIAFGDGPDLPVGSGSEALPGYVPTLAAGGASQFGEARVSRHVLDAVVPGLEPIAFRAPSVTAPPALDGVLAGTGYTVDGSVHADVVAGGLPYRLAEGDDASAEQPVLRLPLRFDDRSGLTPDRRGAELDAILQSAVATGAPAVVRISPLHGSAATYALESLLARAPADVWIGSVAEFAAFWSARSALALDVERTATGWRARLTGEGQVPGQTLVLPFRAERASVAGETAALPLTADGRRTAVPAFTDEVEVELVPAREPEHEHEEEATPVDGLAPDDAGAVASSNG